MAFQKRTEKKSIGFELIGARNDKGTMRLYQTLDTALDDADAVAAADLVKTAVESISDCKVVGFNYLSGVWDDDTYFPSQTGDMRDTATFDFTTVKRKTVSVTVPAFKRAKLVPSRVAAAGDPAPTATAVALSEDAQMVNAGDVDVETFVQLMIAGVTVGATSFTPHAKRDEDGDIVALIEANFEQKPSPRRGATRG